LNGKGTFHDLHRRLFLFGQVKTSALEHDFTGVAELAKGVEDGAAAAPTRRSAALRRGSPKKKRPARS
jgi:hypothetical protein